MYAFIHLELELELELSLGIGFELFNLLVLVFVFEKKSFIDLFLLPVCFLPSARERAAQALNDGRVGNPLLLAPCAERSLVPSACVFTTTLSVPLVGKTNGCV